MKGTLSMLAAVVIAFAMTAPVEAAELTTPTVFMIAGGPTTADCMVTNLGIVPRDVTITIKGSFGVVTNAASVLGTETKTVAAGAVFSHRETISSNTYVFCDIAVPGATKATIRGAMCAMVAANFPGCTTTVVAQ